MFTRNWSLFYKGRNPDPENPADFSIQIVTLAGTAGTIAANNLMWGYRIYTDTYPLAASAPTCM